MTPLVRGLQRRLQVFVVVPMQVIDPPASKARISPSLEPVYTTPLATDGDVDVATLDRAALAVQRTAHVGVAFAGVLCTIGSE
jgi:hypothetical protein